MAYAFQGVLPENDALTTHILVRCLGFLGLLPFLAFALVAVMPSTEYSGIALDAFVGYSAVILSFLGGVLWGRSLPLGDGRRVHVLLLLSNVFALMAWCGLMLSHLSLALALLGIGFLLVLAIEALLSGTLDVNLPRGYALMRAVLTAVVVGLHLALWMRIAVAT